MGSREHRCVSIHPLEEQDVHGENVLPSSFVAIGRVSGPGLV